MARRIDLLGYTFGRLTVVAFHGTTKDRQARWDCICSCGTTHVTRGRDLRAGNVTSCGCFKPNLKHGHCIAQRESREYRAYYNAKNRCNNRKRKCFPDYGGRGIEFRFKSFQEFWDELGECPRGWVLDRINNDGHYEPRNVRWATRSVSNKNRRKRGV